MIQLVKKVAIFKLMLFYCLVSQAAFAKEVKTDLLRDNKKYSVMVNPLGLIFGVFSGNFNFGVSDRMSLGIEGRYFSGSVTSSSNSASITSVGAGVRMNYYLNGPVFGDSWYLSPKLQFARVSTRGASADAIGVGGLIGHSWLYDSGFSMMAGAGVTYFDALAKADGGNFAKFNGVGADLEFSLGYAW